MKKNNLLKKSKKPVVYSRKSSEREAYEQACFYKLIIKDEAKVIEKEDVDVDRMYSAFRDFRLNDFVSDNFDFNKFNVKITISASGNDKIAKVKITKRSFLEKIKCCFSKKELP